MLETNQPGYPSIWAPFTLTEKGSSKADLLTVHLLCVLVVPIFFSVAPNRDRLVLLGTLGHELDGQDTCRRSFLGAISCTSAVWLECAFPK